MRICVISDTHAGALTDLPDRLVKNLSEADLIIHAPDIIIFGHSHQSENVIIDKTLMLNPGPAHSSFAWLEINKEVRAEIVNLQA